MNVLLVGLGRWGEKHLRALGEFGVTIWVAARRRSASRGRSATASRPFVPSPTIAPHSTRWTSGCPRLTDEIVRLNQSPI